MAHSLLSTRKKDAAAKSHVEIRKLHKATSSKPTQHAWKTTSPFTPMYFNRKQKHVRSTNAFWSHRTSQIPEAGNSSSKSTVKLTRSYRLIPSSDARRSALQTYRSRRQLQKCVNGCKLNGYKWKGLNGGKHKKSKKGLAGVQELASLPTQNVFLLTKVFKVVRDI